MSPHPRIRFGITELLLIGGLITFGADALARLA